jgi:hypothetical protein
VKLVTFHGSRGWLEVTIDPPCDALYGNLVKAKSLIETALGDRYWIVYDGVNPVIYIELTQDRTLDVIVKEAVAIVEAIDLRL